MQDTDIQKKKYEISYLLRTDADLEDLRRLLAQHEGEIAFENPPRKIPLAYDIEHTKEAYFGFINFMVAPERAKRLEEDLRTSQKVLRSLIIDLSKEKSVAKESPMSRAARPVSPRSAPGFDSPRSASPNLGGRGGPRPDMAARRPAPAPAISNEALEKKIEEILK